MKRPPESLSSPTAVIASTEGVRVYNGRIAEPICACRLTAATNPSDDTASAVYASPHHR